MSQPLSALSAGSLVKLNENGKATKFIVLGYNHYSKSEVVLLRKDTFAPRQWAGGQYSYASNCYYGSDMDMFCNTQYPQMLDPIIRACLINVPIPVAEGASCGGKLVATLHTLYRKGFLLSLMEATGTAGWQSEGSAFTYLSGSASNRIAYSDETATAVNWWLRSPNSSADSVYSVNASGALNSSGVYDADDYCPRPALALSSLISVSSAVDSYGCYTVESAPAAEQYIKTGGVWTKMV